MSQPAYPALLDTSTRRSYALSGISSFLVGRSETAELPVLDTTCSRRHFRILRAEGRYFVEALSATSPTLRNGQPVGGRAALSHNDRLAAGKSEFVFLAHAPTGSAPAPVPFVTPQPTPNRPSDHTVLGKPGDFALPPPSEVFQAVPATGQLLIGRDDTRASLVLPHPQVSRAHARLTIHNGRATLVDLDSANGTFVNGARVRAPTAVQPGDQIDIGPFALIYDSKALRLRPRSDNVELVARGVTRVVRDRESGKSLTLLHGIDLVIRPQEFVCLLGPSGSGKSTLLSILSGRASPDGGSVLVNEQNLHANFDALKHDIAVVPQKDVLHDSLAVAEALWYTARLRLPPDLRAAEVRSCIDDTLKTVGLTQRRGTRIRYLSGGQVKRASLANEIMCKPSLLFLDEVTSGLDEQTDREMMDLFRAVAEAGKTVVCITHSTANIERTCHLVVILTAGGRLAFVGKPAEALDYFNVGRLGDVYERLAERPAEEWEQQFRRSPHFNRYVAERLPRSAEGRRPAERPKRGFVAQTRMFFRQSSLLTRRYFSIWRGDYASLLAMLVQSVLIAGLLGVLFGDLSRLTASDEKARSMNLLYILGLVSFWFGCNNAAKEIVKERVIYTRERDFNVQAISYYCSKFFLLAVFSGIQTVALAGLTRLFCTTPGEFGPHLAMLLALAVTGVSLGLALSAAAPTEEMAITLIPLAVIPQVILAGVIAPVEGFSKALAQASVTMYWGNRGLDDLLPTRLKNVPFPPLEEGSYSGSLTVVAAHGLACVLAALVALAWRARR